MNLPWRTAIRLVIALRSIRAVFDPLVALSFASLLFRRRILGTDLSRDRSSRTSVRDRIGDSGLLHQFIDDARRSHLVLRQFLRNHGHAMLFRHDIANDLSRELGFVMNLLREAVRVSRRRWLAARAHRSAEQQKRSPSSFHTSFMSTFVFATFAA